MTQPEHPESAESAESPEAAAYAEQPRPAFFRRLPLPRRRRTRFLALGATVVVLAGLAGAAAIAVHHGERHGRVFAGRAFGGHVDGRSDGWRQDGGRAEGGPADGRQDGGRFADGERFGGGDSREAPAPLPALPADQAAVKAAAAVPGGRVDALAVVPQQGGGSAWQLDVLGTDGVRHLLTVDATGTVTSNTTR